MVKKPAFRLTSNSIDITNYIAGNLISLTYEDKNTNEADEISFTVSGLYNIPSFGTNLHLWLGYEDGIFNCGSFSVQTVVKQYTAQTTEVRATSINFADSHKEKRSRTWSNTNLKDLARKIAEEDGLMFETDEYAETTQITHEMQRNVTNMDFLYNLCRTRGFIAMEKNSTIIVYRKDSARKPQMANGDNSSLSRFYLNVCELSDLEITEQNRNMYDSVILEWQEASTATIKLVKVGDGDQIYRMPISEPKSEAEAIQIGSAKLRDAKSGSLKGRFETHGQEIRAGGKLILSGFDSEFTIMSVSHSIDTSGYKIRVEFEG